MNRVYSRKYAQPRDTAIPVSAQSLVSAFISERCVLGRVEQVWYPHLCEAFTRWCAANHVEVSVYQLGKRLGDLGVRFRKREGQMWSTGYGVGLRHE